MRHSLPLFLLAALLCVFVSCKKDPPKLPTIVKGIVVDNETGAPISGAIVEFWVYIPKDQFPGYQQITESVLSKDDGTFEYILRSDATNISPYTIKGNGYVKKNINYDDYAIKLEQTNQFTIPLIHYDATLQLHVKNESGLHASINIIIDNPTFVSEARGTLGWISLYPLAVDIGQEKTYTFPLVSNEYTKIYWDLNNCISNQTLPSNQDSVFILTNNTLNYSIIF